MKRRAPDVDPIRWSVLGLPKDYQIQPLAIAASMALTTAAGSSTQGA